MQKEATIPLVLHQMWLDKHTDTNWEPPRKYLENADRFVQSLRDLNPDFVYQFWNMQRIKELFALPELARWKRFYFDELPLWIQKCDFARYAILFVHGGLYCDLDFDGHRPLASLLKNRSLLWTLDIACHQPGTTFLHKYFRENTTSIYNGFLASIPRHPIWAQLMDFIMYRHDPRSHDVINSTGPAALGTFAQRFGYTVQLRPDLYIDNCLILPYKPPDIFKPRAVCQGCQPFVSTRWIDGTLWSLDPKIILGHAKSCAPALLILLLLVIILVLIVKLKKTKHRMQEQNRNNQLNFSVHSKSNDTEPAV